MKREDIETKIFIDGGRAEETKKAAEMLGWSRGIDGQTTNPSLLAKALGKEKLTEEELLKAYKRIAQEISEYVVEGGDISIEVYADEQTKAEEMFLQAKKMSAWLAERSYIKLPIIKEGLKAAERVVGAGMRINMTLCFSQEQAGAVYAAADRADKSRPTYVSPFVGRLDDEGFNGIDVVRNILKMFKKGDGRVEVLAASLRSYDHVLECLRLGVGAITFPFNIFCQWAEDGFPLVEKDGRVYRVENGEKRYKKGRKFVYKDKGRRLHYKELDIEGSSFRDFDISHFKTDEGLRRFADDWNSLLKS